MNEPFSNPDRNIDSTLSEDTNTELSSKPNKAESDEIQLRYKAAEGYLARSIAGETVIVPVGERSQELNGYATFSETGQFLWNLLTTGERTIEDMIYELTLVCEVSSEEIRNDVIAYVKKMLENGFIVQCS